jgi:hypothetical protein
MLAQLALPLASDLPASTALLIAGVTALAGILGSLVGGWLQRKSAEEQAGAAVKNAQEDRFAAWQQHKRKVYTELLSAARSLRDGPSDPEKLSAFLSKHDEALLVANRSLREYLRGLAKEPDRLGGEWDGLIEKLSADAREGKSAH